jgi:hypothetical protein
VFPPDSKFLQFRGCLQTGASTDWKAAPAASVKIATQFRARPRTPRRLATLDSDKAARVMQATFGMTTFDIAALEQAYAGG